jgi:hypothetical protein
MNGADSAGEAAETRKGAITASLLKVTDNAGIEITSKPNAIRKLGTGKTETGPNKVAL